MTWNEIAAPIIERLNAFYGKQPDDFYGFKRTQFANSRQADYWLNYLDASVFLDFGKTSDQQIYLIRASFDGYGCCNLPEPGNYLLSPEQSATFIACLEVEELDNDQIYPLVKELIDANRADLWEDALKEYGF